MKPFEYIDGIHLLVLHLAAVLRLLRAYDFVKKDLLKQGKVFQWSVYWGDRWENWLMHFIAMWIGVLMLPTLVDACGEWIPFLKDIKSNYGVSMMMTGILGFAGYDGVRFIMDKISGGNKDKTLPEDEK
jgi:hypothetical protein